MKMLKSKKIKPAKIIITIFMYLIGITMMFPLLWMVSSSLKYEQDVFRFPMEWIPEQLNAVYNYTTVWSDSNFGLYYFNTFKVAVLTTVCQVLVSALGAYAFTKIKFVGREKLFYVYLMTLMIPSQVTIIPTFMIFRWLGLYNTHLGLIVLGSFSVYGVFLLRQYMQGIPMSISESAKIDGASHGVIFAKIILPMCQPALVTLAMLKFIWVWNDYQNPLIFLNKPELYTLQLFMKSFQTEYTQLYALLMTAAVLAIIPLIIVFLVAQRYIVDGIAIGSVKG